MTTMNLCLLLCILVSVKIISCAEVRSNLDQSGNRKRSATDPVSNFFSELGDLFMDIDGTVSVQTAPKVEREDRLASQVFGLLNPRREYMERIRGNYRTLQDKLASVIADAITARGAARRAKRLKEASEASLPDNNSGEKLPNIQERGLHARDGITFSENARKQVADTEEQMRKSMQLLVSNARKTTEFLGTLGSQALGDVSSVLIRRSGDLAETDNSEPQGRIIGDDLNSESRFDQYIRQLLRDHGRWVLDNPLLQRWRAPVKTPRIIDAESEAQTKQSSEVPEEMISTSTVVTTADSGSTENYKSSTESLNELPLPEKQYKMPIMSRSYYRVGDDGREVIDEVDVVLQPASGRMIGVRETRDADEETVLEIEDGIDEQPEQDTVILAFTPDGVPLKLRIGPEILNPVKYLQGVLRSAGVSLKVPVESYDDLEPVGKEVLLLGSGSSLITRAVYIDVSNPNELKSLLKTLMKSKVQEKY